MNHLGDNLKEFRIAKGWNQTQMAEYLQISVRSYYDIEKTGEVKKSGVLSIIKEKTGIENTQIIANDPAGTYLQKRNNLKTNGEKKDVPVFNGSTSLGNITMYMDDAKEQIAALPQSVFPGCDYAEKACGDSMYPLIMNQAWLVGRICPTRGITYGEKYIIKTKDGLDTTKFVHPVLDENKKPYVLVK